MILNIILILAAVGIVIALVQMKKKKQG